MADDILTAAKREAESLRAQLARLPTFQKLQQVQKLIDLYELPTARGANGDASIVTPGYVIRRRRPGQTKTARILEIAADHIRTKGGRATSGELLRILQANGVEIGGKRPSTTVASYISNSGLFDNVPGQGYGLKVPASAPESEAPPATREAPH